MSSKKTSVTKRINKKSLRYYGCMMYALALVNLFVSMFSGGRVTVPYSIAVGIFFAAGTVFFFLLIPSWDALPSFSRKRKTLFFILATGIFLLAVLGGYLVSYELSGLSV
jgi:hypothetical protein